MGKQEIYLYKPFTDTNCDLSEENRWEKCDTKLVFVFKNFLFHKTFLM